MAFRISASSSLAHDTKHTNAFINARQKLNKPNEIHICGKACVCAIANSLSIKNFSLMTFRLLFFRLLRACIVVFIYWFHRFSAGLRHVGSFSTCFFNYNYHDDFYEFEYNNKNNKSRFEFFWQLNPHDEQFLTRSQPKINAVKIVDRVILFYTFFGFDLRIVFSVFLITSLSHTLFLSHSAWLIMYH